MRTCHVSSLSLTASWMRLVSKTITSPLIHCRVSSPIVRRHSSHANMEGTLQLHRATKLHGHFVIRACQGEHPILHAWQLDALDRFLLGRCPNWLRHRQLCARATIDHDSVVQCVANSTIGNGNCVARIPTWSTVANLPVKSAHSWQQCSWRVPFEWH
jgi:hypothetical protein